MLTSYGSLGGLYENVTARLSLGGLEGPGKAMGLAPYGRNSNYYEKLKEFVKINPDGDEPFYIADGKIIKTKSFYKLYFTYDRIAEKLVGNLDWDPHGEINQDAANIAWAVQKVT